MIQPKIASIFFIFLITAKRFFYSSFAHSEVIEVFFEVIGVNEVIASLEVIDITNAGDIDDFISGRTIVVNFDNFVTLYLLL